MIIAAFSSRVLTRTYLRHQAGALIVQLPVSGFYALLGFLSAALLVVLLLQGVLSVIVGSKFFNPLQSPSVVLPLYAIFGLLMISAFEKTEIRELGIIKYGVLQHWSDFKSYTWNALTAQNSEVELILKPRLASFLVRSIKLEIPTKYQEAVAMSLSKYQQAAA